MIVLTAASRITATLVDWFAENQLPYPWRNTRDPYAIWVSEMMLQQTQVKTVLEKGYYTRWMARFPNLQVLAEATENEVLRCWEGLGYYARARNMRRAACTLVDSFDGKFPITVSELESLPGIGAYTARAIAAFAYGHAVPVLDANVIRVTARLANFRQPVDTTSGHETLYGLVSTLLPQGDSLAFNSAIMELGQRICLPRRPDCDACPVARWCRGKNHAPSELPVKSPRRASLAVQEHVLWVVHDNCVLLRRESGRRRTGLWKLPERPAASCTHRPVLHDSRYSITHHRVHLLVHQAEPNVAEPGDVWIPIAHLADLPMPAPYRKVVDALLAR